MKFTFDIEADQLDNVMSIFRDVKSTIVATKNAIELISKSLSNVANDAIESKISNES